MKITNKMGLPEPLVEKARMSEDVDPKKIRVTSLLNGTREYLLKKRHWDEIEVDVSDMIWLLFGTAVHYMLESQKDKPGEFKEERLEMQISNSIVTGKSDLYVDGEIIDYKTCSVWTTILRDFEKWEKQLKVYAMLWDSYGFPVKKCTVIPIMKDHKKSEAKRKVDYPPYPVDKVVFPVTKQSIAITKKWVTDKVKDIEKYENVPDDMLPLCTPEERWNKGDKYAVMSNGKKKANKVCDSMAEANAWMAQNKGDYIEKRPGEDVKCSDYCWAKPFCNYGRDK